MKILCLAAAALLAVSTPFAQDVAPKTSPSDGTGTSVVVKSQKASYPLKDCVVCAKPLPAVPVDYVKDGRLYRLEAAGCQAAIDADAAAMAKKVVDAVVAAQKATYPMKVSVVSDKPLEATAVDHVVGTRLVRLASKDEVATFDGDVVKHMAKLDKAYIDAQLASYPLKTCVVSSEPLGGEMGEPVNYLYGTKLVRFCCKSCVGGFEKKPEQYIVLLTKG